MSKLAWLVVPAAVVLAAPVIAAPAMNDANTAQAPAGAPPTAFGTNATVAFYYKEGQHRGVNVEHWSNPSTGIYCIKPSVALNLNKVYPQITVEYGHSSGQVLFAYWQDTTASTDCPSQNLEVKTYTLSGSSGVSSSDVAFDLVVE